MTKSDLEEGIQKVKDLLLPPMGAEFEITYYDNGREVKYGEETHTSASGISAGLKITVIGEDGVVMQRRQLKPFLRDGIYRTMLVANLGDVWLHILGDHIILAKEKLNVGTVAPGMTAEDQAILEAKRNGGVP